MSIRSGMLITVAALLGPWSAETAALPQEIPFKFREGMIWLEVATAKSAAPLNFLLDSGAEVSVLNLRTVRGLGLRLGNQVNVQGVGSTALGYWPERLAGSAGGIALPKRYLAVDLDQLSDSCHCRVDGLLGADFFRDRIVQLDFEAQKLRLLKTADSVAGTEVLPLRPKGSAFLVPLKINGNNTQWLRLDTGCASALHWVQGATQPEISSRRVAVALKEFSVDTTEVNVAFGATQIPSVLAEVHSQAIFEGEDGLLGTGLLSRFRSLIIDARSGKLHAQRY